MKKLWLIAAIPPVLLAVCCLFKGNGVAVYSPLFLAGMIVLCIIYAVRLTRLVGKIDAEYEPEKLSFRPSKLEAFCQGKKRALTEEAQDLKRYFHVVTAYFTVGIVCAAASAVISVCLGLG